MPSCWSAAAPSSRPISSAILPFATRSTVVSALGTITFWLGCWALNYVRREGQAGPFLEAAYWMLPKPADLGLFLVDVLGARDYFAATPIAGAGGDVSPELTVLTSCLVPALALAVATWRLNRRDY